MKLLKTHKNIQIDKAKYNFLMFNFRKFLKYTAVPNPDYEKYFFTIWIHV